MGGLGERGWTGMNILAWDRFVLRDKEAWSRDGTAQVTPLERGVHGGPSVSMQGQG